MPVVSKNRFEARTSIAPAPIPTCPVAAGPCINASTNRAGPVRAMMKPCAVISVRPTIARPTSSFASVRWLGANSIAVPDANNGKIAESSHQRPCKMTCSSADAVLSVPNSAYSHSNVKNWDLTAYHGNTIALKSPINNQRVAVFFMESA